MKKTCLCLLVFIVLALFVSVAPLCAETASPRIPLDSGWLYHLEGDPENSWIPLESTGVTLSNLVPLLSRSTGSESGYVYLKKDIPFSAAPELLNEDISVYFGRITMADETWFNGVRIGSTGRFPPDEFSSWNTARLYHIPQNCLKADGENALTVKIWVDGEGSIVSGPFIGTTADATRAWRKETFWNARIHLLCAFVLVIMATYHFLIYAKRTAERENLLFGLINAISALYLSVFYLEEIPGFPTPHMNFLFYQKVFSQGLPFFFPYLVTSFINSFLGEKKNNVVRGVRAGFVAVPLLIILFAKDYPALCATRNITQFFLVPPVLYIVYILGRAAVRKQKDAGLLLAGFLPLVLVVCADLFIHNVLKMYNFPYITALGWMAVILALLFILAGRFAASRTEAEDLNAHLENKVAERTKELQEANETLAAVNARSEQDLKLASYVQQSFYPKRAPQSKNWEIAYHFRPASGVSGDLYDFFTTNGEFCGAGLFDVSGHGIASGLVTMLSKNVISREFEAGRGKNLATVMTRINEGIVEEKGDIENYLTGILVRLGEDRVEYLNAGHPPLLVRNARNQHVLEAKLSGKADTASGSIIGIPGLPTNFSVIGFTLKSGDAMLFFTDCFEEARNSAGEQYGVERIMKSFQRAGAGDTGTTSTSGAQDKLDFLLRDFETFTRGVPLADDITIIVIQKK